MLQYKPNNRTDIITVSDIIKVSLKCTEVLDKYIPYGKGLFDNN